MSEVVSLDRWRQGRDVHARCTRQLKGRTESIAKSWRNFSPPKADASQLMVTLGVHERLEDVTRSPGYLLTTAMHLGFEAPIESNVQNLPGHNKFHVVSLLRLYIDKYEPLLWIHQRSETVRSGRAAVSVNEYADPVGNPRHYEERTQVYAAVAGSLLLALETGYAHQVDPCLFMSPAAAEIAGQRKME